MLTKSVTSAIVPVARRALLLNGRALGLSGRRWDHGHGGPPSNYKFPTMDELPVPCGSWQEHYDNCQRKYNIHLLFGIGFFVVTLFAGIYSEAFKLYLYAPEKPAPRKAP